MSALYAGTTSVQTWRSRLDPPTKWSKEIRFRRSLTRNTRVGTSGTEYIRPTIGSLTPIASKQAGGSGSHVGQAGGSGSHVGRVSFGGLQRWLTPIIRAGFGGLRPRRTQLI